MITRSCVLYESGRRGKRCRRMRRRLFGSDGHDRRLLRRGHGGRRRMRRSTHGSVDLVRRAFASRYMQGECVGREEQVRRITLPFTVLIYCSNYCMNTSAVSMPCLTIGARYCRGRSTGIRTCSPPMAVGSWAEVAACQPRPPNDVDKPLSIPNSSGSP
jgi:hypothetical protein